MTIGDVLGKLQPDFPDVTISKIRFLESEGLIAPARTPSGYRKFTHTELERLRYILRAQRDHYLPLRVIREQLQVLDRGAQTVAADGQVLPAPRLLAPAGSSAAQGAARADEPHERMARQELLESSGLNEQQLRELETYGLISAHAGKLPYDTQALRIATAVAELAAFGVEPRHLRPAKSAADREVGLVEQVVAPVQRGREPEAGERAAELAQEVAALCVKLHDALVQSALNTSLGR